MYGNAEQHSNQIIVTSLSRSLFYGSRRPTARFCFPLCSRDLQRAGAAHGWHREAGVEYDQGTFFDCDTSAVYLAEPKLKTDNSPPKGCMPTAIAATYPCVQQNI